MTQNKQISEKTVLVTGAAGGMCAGISESLIRHGFRLICVDVAYETLEDEVERLRKLGGDVQALHVDLSDTNSIQLTLETLLSSGIRVDALINAAGVLDRKSMADASPEAFSRVMNINVTAPYALIRVLGPLMIANGWGRIINISSIAGRNGYPFPSYAASKAAISNLTRAMVNEFWGSPVTVNSISPGLVDTPMAEASLLQEAQWRIPTGHAVKPIEIGELCAFLLSDSARSINGADIVIDGGVTSYFQIRSRQAPQ